jgi:excinuclease ABC subunit A
MHVDAYSYNTGEKMVSYSDEQIKTLIVEISQANASLS